MTEYDLAEEIDDTTAEGYMMIDWEQRRMTIRAISRLSSSLTLMSEGEGNSIDEEIRDGKFKRMYAQLTELVNSLKP